jgi:hypothetical protein
MRRICRTSGAVESELTDPNAEDRLLRLNEGKGQLLRAIRRRGSAADLLSATAPNDARPLAREGAGRFRVYSQGLAAHYASVEFAYLAATPRPARAAGAGRLLPSVRSR